ncbi:MAG: hypothetical protein U0132_06965 [Gemmatimonadaceae bacterium]
MSPTPPPVPARRRNVALIAAVLDTLGHQLRQVESTPPEEPEAAPDVRQLIAAAVTEIQRIGTPYELRGGVAPVLGSGVLQGLIRQRHDVAKVAAVPPHDALDERR